MELEKKWQWLNEHKTQGIFLRTNYDSVPGNKYGPKKGIEVKKRHFQKKNKKTKVGKRMQISQGLVLEAIRSWEQ